MYRIKNKLGQYQLTIYLCINLVINVDLQKIIKKRAQICISNESEESFMSCYAIINCNKAIQTSF
jgi:hypothetical protein